MLVEAVQELEGVAAADEDGEDGDDRVQRLATFFHRLHNFMPRV